MTQCSTCGLYSQRLPQKYFEDYRSHAYHTLPSVRVYQCAQGVYEDHLKANLCKIRMSIVLKYLECCFHVTSTSLMLSKNWGINHQDFDFWLKIGRYLASDSSTTSLAKLVPLWAVHRNCKESGLDRSPLHMSNLDCHQWPFLICFHHQ